MTLETYELLCAIREGADVLDHGTAVKVRAIKAEHPDWVEICEPMRPATSPLGRQAYFGAILTQAGCAALDSIRKPRRPLPQAQDEEG